MTKITGQKGNKGFRLILVWSVGLLLAFAIFGVLFRTIFPIERSLDESEYIEQVFVEFETAYYLTAERSEAPAGHFEGGTILFVIGSQDGLSLVRPLATVKPDSVWVTSDTYINYNRESFRQWLIDEERRTHEAD